MRGGNRDAKQGDRGMTLWLGLTWAWALAGTVSFSSRLQRAGITTRRGWGGGRNGFPHLPGSWIRQVDSMGKGWGWWPLVLGSQHLCDIALCLLVLPLNGNLAFLPRKGGDKESVSGFFFFPLPPWLGHGNPHAFGCFAPSWSGLFKCWSFLSFWPFLFSLRSQVPLVLCFMSLAKRGLQSPSSSVFT